MTNLSRIDLGYKPRPWQVICHTHKARFTVLALHRRAGKTELAIAELVNSALNLTLPLGFYAYVAPYLKQAKLIAWSRLKDRLQPLAMVGGCTFNESELAVTFKHNGAIIRVMGADNPDALRGTRLDGAVIDEVGQIKPEVWTDIIQPALSDRLGWALFIGTPKGINLFSELYFKAESLPDWYAASWTVYDTNALPAEEVARLRRDMSDVSFAREYLCDFNAAGSNQLISLGDLNLATARVHKPNAIALAPRILGVDVARFGDDRSVIFPRQGLLAFPPEIYLGLDNMAFADRIAHKIDVWRPDAVFIDAGAGSGVIDRLRQLQYDVVEVHFGGRPSDDRYFNKRAEMWFNMAEWLKAGGSIPDIKELKQDLGAPTYDYHPSSNKIQLESKDDIKERLKVSPDLGDALALTFASPVAVKTTPYATEYDNYNDVYGLNSGTRDANAGSYNPYDNL